MLILIRYIYEKVVIVRARCANQELDNRVFLKIKKECVEYVNKIGKG